MESTHDQNYFPIKNDLSWKDIAAEIKQRDSMRVKEMDADLMEHHQELAQISQSRQHGQLSLDIYQTAADLIIEAPIAGVQPGDLDITIHDDVLTIRGTRKRSQHVRVKDLIYQECHWGAFSRSVVLPVDVISDRVEAELRDGVLTIKLPKASNSRKIKVKGS